MRKSVLSAMSRINPLLAFESPVSVFRLNAKFASVGKEGLCPDWLISSVVNQNAIQSKEKFGVCPS